jgi:FMN reductase
VIGTPIYKAAYSGLLKALLDLLPQFALAGKSVLPLATGGSLAHVLAIDYALRPVLTSLGARHVAQGYFVLESAITLGRGGAVTLDPPTERALFEVVDGLAAALPRDEPAIAAP